MRMPEAPLKLAAARRSSGAARLSIRLRYDVGSEESLTLLWVVVVLGA
jgi:hypothetical protein